MNMDYTTQKIIEVLIGAVLFYLLIGRKLRPLKTGGTAFVGINSHEKIDEAIARLDATYSSPFSLFEAPADVMEILRRDKKSEYALNIFLQRIAAHCNYGRTNVVLRFYEPRKGMPPGRITKMGSTFLMEIYMSGEDNINRILAVIIHEFCHFYLDRSGISLVNTLDNEILTDTAAIYFGFGHLLREGYRPSFKTEKGTNSWSRIGYLDVRGIDYAMTRINEKTKH